MTGGTGNGPLTTLEPLLEAVREGLEASGWHLSGLQKTTSHEFEGRWAGESTRSAYLFFHREGVPPGVSIDVFLDETSRGLAGNLALVVEGVPLRELGDLERSLGLLAEAVRGTLPAGYRTPMTVRLRLPGPKAEPAAAESEYRFKIHMPRAALTTGSSAVAALASTAARAFEALLAHATLERYRARD